MPPSVVTKINAYYSARKRADAESKYAVNAE